MLEPRQAFGARDKVRIGWVWWSVGGQVPSSVLCSLGVGDTAGRIPRNRGLWAHNNRLRTGGFTVQATKPWGTVLNGGN